MNQFVFLTGSPRSGTTILEDLLNHHPSIGALYEPYYLWEKHFDISESDVYSMEQLNPEVAADIRKQYSVFGGLAKKPIVLDKLPTHVFNIPVVDGVFPEAKWIHIYRDGRDVTQSIRVEWNERKAQVKARNFSNLFRVARRMLGYQPFWRFRLKAIWHELSRIRSLSPAAYLNKSRWKGKIGWGPRFVGWQDYYETHSELEFSAKQWDECLAALKRDWGRIPDARKLEIRYEDLLGSPRETLERILRFLGVSADEAYFNSMPRLYTDNTRKWAQRFAADEIASIAPILTPRLLELGYEEDESWSRKAG